MKEFFESVDVAVMGRKSRSAELSGPEFPGMAMFFRTCCLRARKSRLKLFRQARHVAKIDTQITGQISGWSAAEKWCVSSFSSDWSIGISITRDC